MSGFEIASIALAIPALVDQATKIKGYLDDIKGSSAERSGYRNDTESLLKLLGNLEESSKKAKSSPDEFLKNTLKCRATFDELKAHLDQLQSLLKPPNGTRDKVWSSVTWPIGRKKINRIFTQIERSKTHIAIALANDSFQIHLIMKQDHDDRRRQEIVAHLCASGSSNRQEDFLEKRQDGTLEWLLQHNSFKAWRDGNRGMLLFSGRPGAGKTIAASTVVDHLEKRYQDIGTAVIYLYLDYAQRMSQTPTNLLANLLGQLVRQKPTLSREVHDFYVENRDRGVRHFDKISRLLRFESRYFSNIFVVVDALDECQTEKCQTSLITQVISLSRNTRPLFTSRTFAGITEILESDQDADEIEIKATPEDIRRYVEERLKAGKLQGYLKEDPSLGGDISEAIVKQADGMFLLARFQMDLLAAKPSIRDLRNALPKIPSKLDDLYDNAMQRIADQDDDMASLAYRTLPWALDDFHELTIRQLQHALAVRPGDTDIDKAGIYDVDTIVSACAGLIEVHNGTIQHGDSQPQDVQFYSMHHTAQEYFERYRPAKLHDPCSMAATTCLPYLMLDPFNGTIYYEPNCHPDLVQYPFYHEAATFFARHASQISSTAISELARTFMSRTFSFINWSFGDGYMGSRLHFAAGLGCNDIVRDLLDEGANIDETDLFKQTPLHSAARAGHGATVSLLLESGANGNALDSPGFGPLHQALDNSKDSAAQVLINASVNVDLIDSGGTSVLDIAAEKANPTTVQLLIDAGAPINITSTTGYCEEEHVEGNMSETATLADCCRSRGALHYGAESGNLEVVKLLLQHGADVNSTARCHPNLGGERTALHAAVCSGSASVAETLLNRGANVSAKDSFGQTALHLAAIDGSKEMVRLLLKYDPQLSKDSIGRTAVYFAARRGNKAITTLLLNHFRDDTSNEKSLSTAELYRAMCGGDELQCIELIRRGADITVILDDPDTPYHLVDYTNVLKALLRENLGPDSINITTHHFDHSPRINYGEVIGTLLDHGVRINTSNNGVEMLSGREAEIGDFATVKDLLGRIDALDPKSTSFLSSVLTSSLSEADGTNCRQKLQLLVQHGADIKTLFPHGETALHLAVEGDKSEPIEYLLDNGLDPSSKDENGATALDKAIQRGNINAMRALLSHSAGYDGNGISDLRGPRGHELLAKAVSADLFMAKTQAMSVLLDHGADPNATYAPGGETVIHRVAYKGVVPLLHQLLERGANLRAKDNEGLTVMDWAKRGRRDLTIIYLREVQRRRLFGGF